MNARASALLSSLLLAGLTGGCAHYEYDLAQPPEFAAHVGTKQWMTFRRAELEYRLITSDSRLVMLVYNLGERGVRLSGVDSAAVDPHGESHPIAGRTIPPNSYVKLIFPPPPPQVKAYGPTFGFGVGMGYSYAYGQPYHDGYGFGAGMYDDVEPRYYTAYDPDRTYFDWPGETDLRLLLAYQHEGGEHFRHEFVFRKRKM